MAIRQTNSKPGRSAANIPTAPWSNTKPSAVLSQAEFDWGRRFNRQQYTAPCPFGQTPRAKGGVQPEAERNRFAQTGIRGGVAAGGRIIDRSKESKDMFVQATANSIAAAIDNHISTYGGTYSAWYVGIASDPNDRLLNGHNANSQNNAARYWDAGSEETARAIEQHFLKKGCQGGSGGGDSDTKYVLRLQGFAFNNGMTCEPDELGAIKGSRPAGTPAVKVRT